MLLGLGAIALLLSWFSSRIVPRRGLGAMTVAVALGAVMLVTGNYVVSKSFA